jgi:hypothetical protein
MLPTPAASGYAGSDLRMRTNSGDEPSKFNLNLLPENKRNSVEPPQIRTNIHHVVTKPYPMKYGFTGMPGLFPTDLLKIAAMMRTSNNQAANQTPAASGTVEDITGPAGSHLLTDSQGGNNARNSSLDSPQNLNMSSSQLSRRERFDSSVSSLGSMTSLTKEERLDKVRKYWKKKHDRKNNKLIRYECRKNLAEKRFRYQGRFVKFEQLAELDPDMVYDPHSLKTPKTKPIFKIHKEQRVRGSSNGSSMEICSEGDSTFLKDLAKQSDCLNLFSGPQDPIGSIS